MGWCDDSGRHEGWAAAELKDGRQASTYSAGYVLVKGITGNYPADDVMAEYERVPDADVIGWRTQCECGWTGTFVPREDGDDDSMAPEEVEEAAHVEWKKHVTPLNAKYALEDVYWEAKKAAVKVDKAVAEARKAGVSWNDIGMATHMTKQAAHERWGSKGEAE